MNLQITVCCGCCVMDAVLWMPAVLPCCCLAVLPSCLLLSMPCRCDASAVGESLTDTRLTVARALAKHLFDVSPGMSDLRVREPADPSSVVLAVARCLR